jgi:hypothetical protein
LSGTLDETLPVRRIKFPAVSYTVQVFPAVAGAAKRGKRHLLLRVRYRGKTQDFVEEVPRSYTELYIRTVGRRLIAEYWPS